LVAGAVVVFLAAAAFVAFSGFSFRGGGEEASVAINSDKRISGAPELAAASLGRGAAAVAPTPTPVGRGTSPAGAGFGTGAGVAGAGAGGSAPGSSGGTTPVATPASTPAGPVSGAVEGVDQTTSGLGLPPVGEAAQPITGPVDQAVTETLNDVGGPLGGQHLGDQVNDAVRPITDGLLGPHGPGGG
jgi:hypothetical protein